MNDPDLQTLARRTFARVLVVAAVVIMLLLAWRLVEVLLLLFAGVLLAVFLRGIAQRLHRHTGLPLAAMVWSVSLLLLAALGAAAWLLGPLVTTGLDELADTIPQALDYLDRELRPPPVMEAILERTLAEGRSMTITPELVQRLAGIFSTALGAATGLLVILANGLYLTLEPGVYRRGVLRLVAPAHRDRAGQVLAALEHALHWWLVGRIASMTVVGVSTWLGLVLLGLPSAPTLALLAALLTFIPNIGPVLAAVPAVLTGLAQGPTLALYVALLYLGIQTVESYLITPLIQRRVVTLAPALLLTAQLALGLTLGVLGLLLATPLAVVLLVLVQMLYVEDVLGDRIGSP